MKTSWGKEEGVGGRGKEENKRDSGKWHYVLVTACSVEVRSGEVRCGGEVCR